MSEPAPAAPPSRPAGHGLEPGRTFETFVVGPGNRFAHAAAFAVAEAPARAYNPLFIYGDSGRDKTHLLHAIGHYAQAVDARLKVRYVTAGEFGTELIGADRDDFRRRYRDLDMLLVDDIQLLADTDDVQEEFFGTFSVLHHAGRQIVISSDRAPKRLVALPERLRNRFEWGLLVDL